MIDWIKKIFQETKSGEPSSIRLALFVTVVGIVGITIYAACRHYFDATHPFDIGEHLSTLLSTTIASLSAAKAWQKGSENAP